MIRFVEVLDYFQHQLQSGRTHPTHVKPRRDGDGRRLRASAYGRRATASALAPTSSYSWSSILAKAVLAMLLASVAFMASSKAYINFAGDLPDANAIAAERVQSDTLVYASDGTTLLADLHPGGYQHYDEPLSAIGTWLPASTIAVEDANFYHEPGIDVTAMARAAWVDWREHRPVQGASTITQQLVKLRLVGNEPSLTRKIKEAVLALQVERAFSKQQILEMYLNTVFYGNDAYGSAAAAKIYFHTVSPKLDLAQASMLAGIPQNPTYNNPFANWVGAKARQLDVLNALVRTHKITPTEADQAYRQDISPPKHMFRPFNAALTPGFVSYVSDVLKSKYGVKTTYGGGLRVVTTLNWNLQQIAQNAVRETVDANAWRHLSQGALVSLNPRTGAIMAMVGSAYPNKPGGQYNFAVWPPRNPGSSMKIYNYTAAINSHKFTMVTPIADTPLTVPAKYVGSGEAWQPKNYDLRYHGVCQLQQCMGNSLNVPAVKVELSIGVPAVVQMARDMGAPPWRSRGSGYSKDDPVDSFPFSTTLGSVGETPLQMATGASVLAAQGILHPPFAIQRITSSDAVEIFKANPDSDAKQVLDPRVAYIMEQIMSDDDNRAMIFGRGSAVTLPGRRVGAKTGTTDDWKDAWTVGYTPSVATAVWMGNPDWSAMVVQSDGIYVAAPAWHQYMQRALDFLHKGSEWFSEPAGLLQANVNGKLQWFLPDTSPSQPAPPLPSFVLSSSSTNQVCGFTNAGYVCFSPSASPKKKKKGGGGG